MEFLVRCFLLVVLLTGAISCSSGKKDTEIDSLENAEVLTEDVTEEVAQKANEKAGFELAQPEILTGGPPLLHFFPNKLSYGLLMNNFQWGQPLTVNNPGVDCKLKLKKIGPPYSLFTCVVKYGKENPSVVTAIEGLQGKDRKLMRVVLDAKGKGLKARWSQDIRTAGYRPIQGKKATFISPDRKTILEVVPAKNVISAVFRPAGRF